MSVRQTRKGCFQQCFGCEAPDEFKWFDITDEKNEQFATSLEESDCCMRLCCTQCHEFTMVAKEESTNEEILTMHRPCVRSMSFFLFTYVVRCTLFVLKQMYSFKFINRLLLLLRHVHKGHVSVVAHFNKWISH